MRLTRIFLLLLLIPMAEGFSQQYYFETKQTHCQLIDADSKKKFDLGIQALQFKKHWGTATNIFLDLTKKDSTFCDGYFMAGYTLRLQENFRGATAMYYMADSLSPHPILEYKQNLATLAAYSGAIELARMKYEEMVSYFPSNPEGYYGIATTALDINDFETGLANINMALTKYNKASIKFGGEVYIVKGMLLGGLKQYGASKIVFEKVKGKLKKDDNYLIYYALSLKLLGEEKNDQKLIAKAKTTFGKIKDKAAVPESISSEFKK